MESDREVDKIEGQSKRKRESGSLCICACESECVCVCVCVFVVVRVLCIEYESFRSFVLILMYQNIITLNLILSCSVLLVLIYLLHRLL